ncbi:uncharacterized protein LOC134270747 [Saccostrea cucullata]|uniref:uncharacterized protein LOC134270747 n=1 Tax=Saccostrea cuccullata TaxID=36930 RepID=UPI002ED0FCAA
MKMRNLRYILNLFGYVVGLITVEAQYYNRYYSYYRYTSNSTSASTTSTQNYNTLLYIGAIVGVLVCVVAIVIIVVTCMCCRRKQRTAGTVIHSTSNPTNVVFSTSQVPSHSSSEALNSQQQFHQRTGISPPPYHNDSLPPPYSDGNLSSSPYTNEPLPPLYSKDPPQEILNRTTPSAPSLHDLDK